jgi:hypothetical protein
MKQAKTIFVPILLLFMVVHGMSNVRVCIGSTHCHSGTEWATQCHSPSTDVHDADSHSLNHQDCLCVDISISTVFGSAYGSPYDGQQYIKSPVTIESAVTEHPLSGFDFTRLTASLLPDFIDAKRLSIQSTILNI